MGRADGSIDNLMKLWTDGSEEEKDRLTKQALSTGGLELNQETYPGCYYHRTAENDVARGTSYFHLYLKRKMQSY